MLRTAIMAAMLTITATGAAAESLTDLQKDEVVYAEGLQDTTH